MLYVLDEPSIGLHQRDNEKLIKSLQDIRDLGNSVLVVEHDEDTMRAQILLLILVQELVFMVDKSFVQEHQKKL